MLVEAGVGLARLELLEQERGGFLVVDAERDVRDDRGVGLFGRRPPICVAQTIPERDPSRVAKHDVFGRRVVQQLDEEGDIISLGDRDDAVHDRAGVLTMKVDELAFFGCFLNTF